MTGKSESRSVSGSGFTLVELLVAMAILAISMMLVYGVYNSTFTVVGHVDQRGVQQRRVLLLFDQLQRDFFGIYKGQSGYFRAEEPQALESGTPFLQFATSSHLSFDHTAPPVSLTRVSYFLKKTGNKSTFDLYRIEVPFKLANIDDLDSGRTPLLVCEGVSGITLRYKDSYGTFLDQWQARSAGLEDRFDDLGFPFLIRIELQLMEGNGGKTESKPFTALFNVPSAQVMGKSVGEGS